MSMNKGLGRGLDALLGGVREEEEKGLEAASVQMIPVSSVVANPYQPRREFDSAALDDLAASIKAQGVLQPILVRPVGDDRYELVAGERRLRASKIAGLVDVPSLVREMNDQESLAIALIENLQREDLNPVEEALGYQQLQKEFGLSQDELSRQVGKSRSAVANSLRLLNLPEEVQQHIQMGKISAGHGRAIMAITESEPQADLHERIMENGLTVRQAEAQASFWKQNGRLPGADEVGAPVKSAGATSHKESLDPSMQELQAVLCESLDLAVKVSGSQEKGRITLSYRQGDELRSLLEKLGVESPF
ncbi:ParB/RepB/Spo0J family partition protein [Salidesulfovibrio onnuriiensis]|uniref:ParB/RepB/Spo0J family partition protein n=1 Tax=Salidesulfovibrio onnuriiensis TaxID=2583823 RepID=UPI0011CAEA98|nr:ParB/RepB/Spo0J family partition protein [Salidesulfovibrio onnuriiensis]